MESLTKNRQSVETIQKMVQYTLNRKIASTDDAIIELEDGWFNVAYSIKLSDGIEVILKISPSPNIPVMTYEKDMMKNEVHFLKMAQSLGIPCPSIYGYDTSKKVCSSDYFFMEKLEGHSFEHIKNSLDEPTIKSINYEIGHLTKQLNSNTNSSFFGYWHSPILQAPTWKEAFLKMIDAILEDGIANQVEIGYDYLYIRTIVSLNSDSLSEVTKPCLIHWDIWDSNVFINNQRISGILDFERAFYGDPLAEALFRMKEPNQLLGYGIKTFSQNELCRMKLYDLYLALIMIIEDSYRHYNNHSVKAYGLLLLSNTVNDLSHK